MGYQQYSPPERKELGTEIMETTERLEMRFLPNETSMSGGLVTPADEKGRECGCHEEIGRVG